LTYLKSRNVYHVESFGEVLLNQNQKKKLW
jgi:hypothetical protein